MFDLSLFLDRARAGAGNVSDYRLAQLIGVTRQAISKIRNGTPPSAEVALRLCDFSGDDPEHVLACLQSMRAANDDEAAVWQRIAGRLRRSSQAFAGALVALAAAVSSGGITKAEAAPLPHDAGRGSVYYVKRRRILRWSDSARRLSPASTRHAAAA